MMDRRATTNVCPNDAVSMYVLSGSCEGIEQASALARERGGRALPLKVSGAFHSPDMDRAARELAKALSKATWNKARFPVYCNAIGRAVHSGEDMKEAMLIQNDFLDTLV